MRIRAAVVLLALLLAGACAGEEMRVTGTVTMIIGDLTGITSFEVRPSGEDPITFEPDDELDFFSDGTTPMAHLFEHVQTGQPVRVTYRVEGGVNVAIAVEDA
jgi:hypothetical protein